MEKYLADLSSITQGALDYICLVKEEVIKLTLKPPMREMSLHLHKICKSSIRFIHGICVSSDCIHIKIHLVFYSFYVDMTKNDIEKSHYFASKNDLVI